MGADKACRYWLFSSQRFALPSSRLGSVLVGLPRRRRPRVLLPGHWRDVWTDLYDRRCHRVSPPNSLLLENCGSCDWARCGVDYSGASPEHTLKHASGEIHRGGGRAFFTKVRGRPGLKTSPLTFVLLEWRIPWLRVLQPSREIVPVRRPADSRRGRARQLWQRAVRVRHRLPGPSE